MLEVVAGLFLVIGIAAVYVVWSSKKKQPPVEEEQTILSPHELEKMTKKQIVDYASLYGVKLHPRHKKVDLIGEFFDKLP